MPYCFSTGRFNTVKDVGKLSQAFYAARAAGRQRLYLDRYRHSYPPTARTNTQLRKLFMQNSLHSAEPLKQKAVGSIPPVYRRVLAIVLSSPVKTLSWVTAFAHTVTQHGQPYCRDQLLLLLVA